MDRFTFMQTLVAVVDADSFVAASRALRVSESTVSRRVAELERHLGTQLVYRDAHRLFLTSPGEAFVARCRHILDELEKAEDSLMTMRVTSELGTSPCRRPS